MDGTAQIGTGTLNASGQVTFTITNFSVGSHSLTAVYEGAAAYVGSSSGPLSQVVNKADTTTTISSSVNPSTFGQSTTLTAIRHRLRRQPQRHHQFHGRLHRARNGHDQQRHGDDHDLDTGRRRSHAHRGLRKRFELCDQHVVAAG